MKIDAGLADDFRENWHIEPESIDRLADVEPDPVLGLSADNDYRRIIEVNTEASTDPGWAKFKKLFLSEGQGLKGLEVSYGEYIEWKKDEMKLGKYLAKFFTRTVLREYGLDENITFKNDLFARYFQKEMDEIGTVRIAGKKHRVLLSFNPLDKIMASGHKNFRSCVSLDSTYGMWRTLPANIWNRNIAILGHLDGGTTKYTLKNGYEFEVPSIINRTWVYVVRDSAGQTILHLPRYYDRKFLNTEDLAAVVGVPVADNNNIGKFRIVGNPEPGIFPVMNIKGIRSVCTPYFDSDYGIEEFDPDTLEYQLSKVGGVFSGHKAIKLASRKSFGSFAAFGFSGSYEEEDE